MEADNEEKAKDIMNNISTLRNSFENMYSHMDILGKHLNNAKIQYDETVRSFEKIGNKLSSIETMDHSDPVHLRPASLR